MTMTVRARRGAHRASLRFAAASAIALAAAFAVAAPAAAHDSLVSSTPSDGEELTALPTEFSVTTNEGMLDLSGIGSGFALHVLDADGLYYGDGCLEIVDATMSTPATLGAEGNYTLVWQAVSADGHTVSDTISFTWNPPAGFEPATGVETAPTCGADETESPAVVRTESSLSDVLWIGGGVLALAVAAIVTYVVFGSKRGGRRAED